MAEIIPTNPLPERIKQTFQETQHASRSLDKCEVRFNLTED